MRILKNEADYTLVINEDMDSVIGKGLKAMIGIGLDCKYIYTSYSETIETNEKYTVIDFRTAYKPKKVIKTIRKFVPSRYDLYVKDNKIVAYVN